MRNNQQSQVTVHCPVTTERNMCCARPAWRRSFTTSCVDGTSPSAPPPNLSSSKDAARAAAQALRPLLQDGRFRPGLGLCQKRQKPSCLLRPPSPNLARTTKRARSRGPESSGQVLSFKRLAVAKTAPSTSTGLGCGEPSQCRGYTNVVSTASCGRPSARISKRR